MRNIDWLCENGAPNQPTSQPDAPKTAENAENGASKYGIRDFDDSREKLEADIHEFKLRHAQDKLELIAFESIACRWLDRQAAIIERECEEREEDLRRRFWKRVEDDDLDIARLTAERDWLVREVNGLMKNQPYTYDPETPIASLKTLGRYIGKQSEELDAVLRKLDDEKRMTAFLRRQSRG